MFSAAVSLLKLWAVDIYKMSELNRNLCFAPVGVFLVSLCMHNIPAGTSAACVCCTNQNVTNRYRCCVPEWAEPEIQHKIILLFLELLSEASPHQLLQILFQKASVPINTVFSSVFSSILFWQVWLFWVSCCIVAGGGLWGECSQRHNSDYHEFVSTFALCRHYWKNLL